MRKKKYTKEKSISNEVINILLKMDNNTDIPFNKTLKDYRLEEYVFDSCSFVGDSYRLPYNENLESDILTLNKLIKEKGGIITGFEIIDYLDEFKPEQFDVNIFTNIRTDDGEIFEIVDIDENKVYQTLNLLNKRENFEIGDYSEIPDTETIFQLYDIEKYRWGNVSVTFPFISPNLEKDINTIENLIFTPDKKQKYKVGSQGWFYVDYGITGFEIIEDNNIIFLSNGRWDEWRENIEDYGF